MYRVKRTGRQPIGSQSTAKVICICIRRLFTLQRLYKRETRPLKPYKIQQTLLEFRGGRILTIFGHLKSFVYQTNTRGRPLKVIFLFSLSFLPLNFFIEKISFCIRNNLPIINRQKSTLDRYHFAARVEFVNLIQHF